MRFSRSGRDGFKSAYKEQHEPCFPCFPLRQSDFSLIDLRASNHIELNLARKSGAHSQNAITLCSNVCASYG
ncbi:hypothetical protein PRIC1_014754 [Phytophthora ramorum]